MADPVSSVAYSIEAALRALDGDLGLLLPAMGMVVALIALIIVNYHHLVARYPQGGGAAAAAGDAFGEAWAFIPIGALIVDFALTIAISSAAGASAIIASPLQPGRHAGGSSRWSTGSDHHHSPAGRLRMAIVVVFDAPGFTQAQYEQAADAVTGGHGSPKSPADFLVPGLISHTAAPTPDGWLVVEVWESKQAQSSSVKPHADPAGGRLSKHGPEGLPGV